MDGRELITVAAILVLGIVIGAIGLRDRARRRRAGRAMSGVLGTFDEVFHPEAARASEIREVQRELPAELGDADGPGSTPAADGNTARSRLIGY